MDEGKEAEPRFKSKLEVRTFYETVQEDIRNKNPVLLEDIFKKEIRDEKGKIKMGVLTLDTNIALIHGLNISENIIDEACNMVQASIQNVLNTKKLDELNPFSHNYILRNTIPSLYYAHADALLSIEASFGYIPTNDEGKTGLLITGIGCWIDTKKNYLNRYLKIQPGNHHQNILKIYIGLSNQGVNLPTIDLEKSHELRSLREKFHYQILSSINTKQKCGSIHVFFEHLPHVLASIHIAIQLLKEIKGSLNMGVEKKFKEILKKAQECYIKYEIKIDDSINNLCGVYN